MANLLTKKNALIISSVYLIYLVAILSLTKCYGDKWCPFNIYHLDHISVYVLLPLLPIFFLSLLTYKLRDEVFRVWVNFAKWWVPFSIIWTLLIPEKTGGFISVPYQSIFALFAAGLFSFISLILITWKWFALRGKP